MQLDFPTIQEIYDSLRARVVEQIGEEEAVRLDAAINEEAGALRVRIAKALVALAVLEAVERTDLSKATGEDLERLGALIMPEGTL